MSTPRRRRRQAFAAGIAALVAAGSFTLVTGQAAQADDALPGDGTTSITAGASCWGIKQEHPASGDGIYFLNTAALERPTRVYCDMTTDGGGWVLVGRGREGWTFSSWGQGSGALVRDTVDGPEAFAPAALSTVRIDQLLGGTPLDELSDGIRLERSLNSSGSQRQDYRLLPDYQDWTWDLPAGEPLEGYIADGTTYAGGTTRDTGGTGTRRMWTYEWASHDNKKGFAYGSGVSGGSSSATNHLWTAGGEGYPIPFTRVWLRPEIANDQAGFTPIPAEGFDAEAVPSTLKNRSELAPWGVVGVDHTGESQIEPWKTNVLSLHVAGDRVYVGGRFTGVQQGPSATEVPQPYLAAFDLDGTWISTFRPEVEGRVWDIDTTPDGNLVIAGDFTSVNGAAGTAGMAKLDPDTGELVAGFKADFARTTGPMVVRTIDLDGDLIYAAGSFNRLTGANWGEIKVTNAANVSADNGRPGQWRPQPRSHVVDLDVSVDGTRVLLGGYFNRIVEDENHGYFGIVDASVGNPVPGIGAWQPSTTRAKYQQAVLDLGDGRIFTGGSEHNIQLWDWNRQNLLDAAITKAGGDTQAMEVVGDYAYVACHCGDWVYEGTNSWPTPTDYRSKEPINLVGRWDVETWNYDTSWYPSSLHGEYGEGIWTIDGDDEGCLWVGGDLKRGGWSGNEANDWLGGFARFCQDVANLQPPTEPTDFDVQVEGPGAVLTWGASTDDGGTVSYDVYRDDRVIASVWGTTFTDPDIAGENHTYTVRAVDPQGNRSSSPAPVAVNGPAPAIGEVLAFGSEWRYQDSGADQGVAWREPGFDDSGWASGAAKLGWGRWDVVTAVGPTKPNTVYARSTFEIDDPSQVRVLDLQSSVATGSIVYVNGIEVGRINMPDGAVSASTPAGGYIWGEEERRLKPVEVPADVLVAGTNTIAVEIHNMTANASRLFFDLQATAYGSNGNGSAPTAPTLSATPTDAGVDLSWTTSSDDESVAGYVVRRDGEVVVVRVPGATTYTDLGVDTSVPHTYEVTAFDGNGNATASNTVSLDTVVDPYLLGYGADWRWFYVEGGPTGDWKAEAYDDSTWATGAAELGFGEGDESTVLTTGPTPRPATAYFRTTVEVADPSAFAEIVANVIRDDGLALYVNGVEVGRDSLPAGEITFDTLATDLWWTNADERTPVQFSIPSTAFRAGTNTIAVEVHNGDRWSGDLSFDLQLIGQP